MLDTYICTALYVFPDVSPLDNFATNLPAVVKVIVHSAPESFLFRLLVNDSYLATKTYYVDKYVRKYTLASQVNKYLAW